MAQNPDLLPADGGFGLRIAAGLLVFTALTVGTGFYMAGRSGGAARATGGVIPSPGGDVPITAGAKPAGESSGVPLFAGWPKAPPDLVVVLTGQTYGYLKPCGCSQNQLGGLERRANFMQQMRAKGWPVVGLDLGDVMPSKETKGLYEQAKLKYATTMKAMREMGYAAVGLGQTDIESQLWQLLGEFTLNNPGKPPVVLAGNIAEVQRAANGQVVKSRPREVVFKVPGPDADRPMVEAVEVVADKDKGIPLGVAGLIGPSVYKPLEKAVPAWGYEDGAATLKAANAAMDKHPANPQLRALLYQGSFAEAQAAAVAFPQFQLVLCHSDESEPPTVAAPANGGKTLIVQVGHKGRYVGVVGVFKTPAGFDLKYQLVPMGEEYATPETAEDESAQKVLPLLQKYADLVKRDNLLERPKKMQHPVQAKHAAANLTYVGSQACVKCHAAEGKVWGASKHAHAYDALEKIAKRPSLRNFDPECINCHVVGYEYESGFKNAKDTPQLLHNGCENCHGPGSAHAEKPKNAQWLAAMYPWRAGPEERLPPKDFLEKMAAMKDIDRGGVEVPARQQMAIRNVATMCQKCHDGENDPKFDFYTYYLKVTHSGLKAAGLPPGAK